MLSVVADIGGTNIRLSVCDLETGELSRLREFACAEFITLDAAFVQYFSTLHNQVKHLCIAIACPIEGDYIKMTNLSWEFSKAALKDKLGVESLHVINDYTAISLSVPFVEKIDRVQIGTGIPKKGGAIAVFGPGTGLGVSHLVKHDDKWVSLDGEGGHVSFAPNTREQADILLLLQEQFGHVSAERVISGQGLVNLYHSLCRLEGKQPEFHTPQEISKAALDDDCKLAVRTLTVFCQIIGGFAGDLALNLACSGGVYIAGGVVPRFREFFKSSEFRTFFEEKGRMKDYLLTIPTYLITHDNPGLLGASVYLRQELGFINN